MIGNNVKEILNEQINKEFYSAYLYLAMSAYLSEIGLYGFSKWAEIQAREEIDHGMIVFEYLIKQNARVELKNLETPQIKLGCPQEIFEQIYEHEKTITESINSIAKLTENECDLATRKFIDWYLDEQIEEEDNIHRILQKMKNFGAEKASLYLIDKELGERKYQQHFLSEG